MPATKYMRGFTLVEVLVALLVLAVAMTAWQLRISQQVESAGYLREKALAQWVALDQLTLLRIAGRMAPRSSPSLAAGQVMQGTAQLAGRTWYWQIAPLDLARTTLSAGDTSLDQMLLPVVVSVSATSADAAATSPLVTLTGVSHGAPATR